MAKRLRFTGKNPLPSLADDYPNWENAYDEEGSPGQDETTLRPADNQKTIDDMVSFTAADALLANGTTLPAWLYVVRGELGDVHVYPDPKKDEVWAVRFDSRVQNWVAQNQAWLLQIPGIVRVPVNDSAVFPVRITSRLPLQRTGSVIAVEIAQPVEP
jgi:hypothetical protein